jgi:hypothetical protein
MPVTKNGVTYRWAWLHIKWLRRPFLVIATPVLFLAVWGEELLRLLDRIFWQPLKKTHAMKEILELW